MTAQALTLYRLPIGTTLTRPKEGLLLHFGIQYAPGWVFEHTEEAGGHLVTYEDFSKGLPVTVAAQPTLPAAEVQRRIDAELSAKRPYDVVWDNCETAVNRILHGISISVQVIVVALLILAAILVGRKLVRG